LLLLQAQQGLILIVPGNERQPCPDRRRVVRQLPGVQRPAKVVDPEQEILGTNPQKCRPNVRSRNATDPVPARYSVSASLRNRPPEMQVSDRCFRDFSRECTHLRNILYKCGDKKTISLKHALFQLENELKNLPPRGGKPFFVC
jgi:hypothetical protein